MGRSDRQELDIRHYFAACGETVIEYSVNYTLRTVYIKVLLAEEKDVGLRTCSQCSACTWNTEAVRCWNCKEVLFEKRGTGHTGQFEDRFNNDGDIER